MSFTNNTRTVISPAADFDPVEIYSTAVKNILKEPSVSDDEITEAFSAGLTVDQFCSSWYMKYHPAEFDLGAYNEKIDNKRKMRGSHA
jgi:hypothetical protein